MAGVAVAVVREGEVVSRGFGVRDVTGAPVTPETMFHLASVSKPFVATAVVSLATPGARAVLDLDAPIGGWVPDPPSPTAGSGGHRPAAAQPHQRPAGRLGLRLARPRLGDDALSEFASSLSGWRLQTEPGATFPYSNAGFELLGLLLARATGTTFEDAVRQQVLAPLGMRPARSCAARCPSTWRPHRTSGCR